MKRAHRMGLVLFILFVIALLILLLFRKKQPSPVNVLDEGKVYIESPVAREFLGSDSIRVRRSDTPYQPSGVLSVPEFEPVTDPACRELLDRLIRQYALEGEVIYTKDVFALKGADAALWVSRASGAFKLTKFRESMAVPSAIDAQRALRIALEHVAKAQLVQLNEAEELDVLYVSAVMNAVHEGEQDTVVEPFLSDRYVAFGRRYQGVPIVGSALVFRLDGQGNIVMIRKDWRKIQQFQDAGAKVDETPLEVLMANDPAFRERYPDTTIAAKDIHVVSRRCGYVEAPAGFVQRHLRPACEVSYYVGDRRGEALSEMVLSSEKNISRDQFFGVPFDGQALGLQPSSSGN